MLPKALIALLGLPFAIFCCLLVPLVFITVFAGAPLVLAYRYASGSAGAKDGSVFNFFHHSST